MAGCQEDEKQSIRDYAKSLKKYGSTCNHFKRQEQCVKHHIIQGDTLQGIALKYGVNMEQIRRVNRLWATDSLFLRESLMIPVNKDTILSPDAELYTFEGSISSSSLSNDESDQAKKEERSIKDFLIKIDNSIANTKTQVEISQGNSEFLDHNDLFTRKKPPAISRMRQQQHQQQQSHSSNPMLSAPPAVVMSQGKKIRSSLQRLEKEQDEMFEL